MHITTLLALSLQLRIFCCHQRFTFDWQVRRTILMWCSPNAYKLGSSPLKVPKALSLPCPFPHSFSVVVPPTAPNVITTEKDKVALSSDLKTSLDPKFMCWHSLPALSMNTTACQAHLRVTALEKRGKHFSASRLPFFLSKAISGHLAFSYLFIFNRGEKNSKPCTREGEHLKWISQRFPSLPLTPPQENAWLR